MRVAVLGAGVVGITTAYYLAKNGCSVQVIDSAEEVAAGASAANGGQLSYSFTDAFANPKLLRCLPAQILGLDPAVLVRPVIDAKIAGWGLSLLRQCTRRRAFENTSAVLKLAGRSSELMSRLREEVPIEFSHRRSGKLVLLSDDSQLQAALASSEFKREQGCDVQVVTYAEACEIEPGLCGFNKDYEAAVWSAGDEVGDAREFTSAMADWLGENKDFELQLGTEVLQIEANGAGVQRVNTSNGALEADAVVVCLGTGSPSLLKPLGINTQIYPVRGYSVTLPAPSNPISCSITDLDNKMVFSRLGSQIRIAGFADIVGFDTRRDSDRVRVLLQTARTLAPEIADFDTGSITEWGGFRPLTPDSRPRVGATPVKGLFLNTGHGMLGWTLACATGHEVAQNIKRSRS